MESKYETKRNDTLIDDKHPPTITKSTQRMSEPIQTPDHHDPREKKRVTLFLGRHTNKTHANTHTQHTLKLHYKLHILYSLYRNHINQFAFKVNMKKG